MTDVLFTGHPVLRDLDVRRLRRGRAEDVLTVLGGTLHGGFAGEVLNNWKRPWPVHASSTG